MSGCFRRVTSSVPYIASTVSLGLFADSAVYGLLIPVLPFRLQATGYSDIPATSSYLIAAFAFGLIVSSLPIAILSEVIQSRKLPLLACLGFLAASLVLFWKCSSFPVLVIARIFQGFSGTAIWTLGLALISDVVPEAHLGRVMGYVMIGWSVGNVGGPLAGGLLYDSLGYDSVFVFALVITGIDFILRALVQEKRGSPVTNEGPPSVEIEDKEDASESTRPASKVHALLSLLTNSRCWALCGLTFVFAFAFCGLLDAGMTVLVRERYGLSSRGAALILLAAVAPSLVSSPLAGRLADAYGAKRPILGTLFLGTPFLGVLSIDTSLPIFIASVGITGLLLMGLAAPISQDLAEVVKATPGLGFAHVYGIFNLAFSVGALVGPLCVGALLQHKGIAHGWQIACFLAVALFVLCFLPTHLFLTSKNSSSASISAPTLSSPPPPSNSTDLESAK